MDKRIILAVAGSGKTSLIIERLNKTKRVAVITYTINNHSNIKRKIINKFGYIPNNIMTFTYYGFLVNFCYKPYLCFRFQSKGINWNRPPKFTQKLKRDNKKYYFDNGNRLYHNRIAKLLEIGNTYLKIIKRIEKYFDLIMIDEVQDFAGHDFNFLISIIQANIEVMLVGDYYQHTYDTSNDGNINKNLYSDFHKYIRKFTDINIYVDTSTLKNSYRCSPTICEFITKNLNIPISSQRKDETDVVLIKDSYIADEIFKNQEIVKLFYQNHRKYPCYSENWGASKGLDNFIDVCVVLNKTTYEQLKKNSLSSINVKTRNKLYVACTRARGKLFLIPDDLVF